MPRPKFKDIYPKNDSTLLFIVFSDMRVVARLKYYVKIRSAYPFDMI